YQVPIKIGDTDINPGDFIIADIDGVVVVPKQIAREVLAEAEATVSKESKMRAELREGKSIIEVFDTYGVF
ncbi:MAG: RraA family protein, partial [Sediminispirochaetaceae bacterium]